MGTFWPLYPIASFSPSQQVTRAASVICVFSFIFKVFLTVKLSDIVVTFSASRLQNPILCVRECHTS